MALQKSIGKSIKKICFSEMPYFAGKGCRCSLSAVFKISAAMANSQKHMKKSIQKNIKNHQKSSPEASPKSCLQKVCQKLTKSLLKTSKMVDLGDPLGYSKLVVRVPMGIRFSKFEILYLKNVMESDFRPQNYSKL